MAAVPPEPEVERVGIILVHGIGEQRRFQHLDGQLRDLLRALHHLRKSNELDTVSVDIASAGAAAFQADQDSWTSGPKPSVTVITHQRAGNRIREVRLEVHEVWWADVNEPYSLAKQFRFWLWGLAVWAHPGKPQSGLGTAGRVYPPKIPNRSALWDRTRLFLTGVFFVLVGYSIGALTFLANRLLNWQTPDVLKVIANYISAVKLYNQRRRFGPGLWWAKEEFLDSIGEPPRVSVRRRMIRAIADVACNLREDPKSPNDRWYVLAHSQGSVVAFNGLMETAYAWPGYLDERRWTRLVKHKMAGPALPTFEIPTGRIMPRRPGWAAANDIAYRQRIFARFRGLLTYGSPLEKFAGIWPALVPISREPGFQDHARWINLYDPVDPVSGRLLAFSKQPVECCPHPTNIGYAASDWLLLAHLKYLTRRKRQPDAATVTVRWLLTGETGWFTRNAGNAGLGTSYDPNGPRHRKRSWLAWASCIAAAIVLLGLGAVILPTLLSGARSAAAAVIHAAAPFLPHLAQPGEYIARGLARLGEAAGDAAGWVHGHLIALAGSVVGAGYPARAVSLLIYAAALTLAVGILSRAFFLFRRDPDDPRRAKPTHEDLKAQALHQFRLRIMAAQQEGAHATATAAVAVPGEHKPKPPPGGDDFALSSIEPEEVEEDG
jgi:hypothetical protein